MGRSEPTPPGKLLRTQQWFGSIIQRPIDLESRIDPISPSNRCLKEEAKEYIAPSAALEPIERIEIYNQQYWWRLLGILQEEFPLVTRLFGYEEFNEVLAVPYLVKYPPDDWSLVYLGNRFVRWIEEEYRVGDKPLLLESASLDWAYNYSFIAPHFAPFGSPGRRGTPPEAGLQVPVALQPHLHLFSWDYDLFEIRKEFLKQDPDYWLHAEFPPLNRERKYWFVFYRDPGNHLVYQEISDVEYDLLRFMQVHPGSLEKVIDWIGAQSENFQIEAGASIAEWTQKWVANQWLYPRGIDT